jgi:hypothetical protein
MPAVGTEYGQPQAPAVTGRSPLTLEPLRSSGPDSLDAHGLSGITQIILCEIELLWDNTFHEITIRRSDNLFASAIAGGSWYDPVPDGCTLLHATFHIQFTDSPNPREVDIRPPFDLKLASPADAPVVDAWLQKRGFKELPQQPSSEPSDAHHTRATRRRTGSSSISRPATARTP